jgi:hypothetical protein
MDILEAQAWAETHGVIVCFSEDLHYRASWAMEYKGVRNGEIVRYTRNVPRWMHGDVLVNMIEVAREVVGDDGTANDSRCD